MSKFLKRVDWRKYFKIVGIFSLIIISAQVINKKIDWFAMTAILLFIIVTLLKAYTEYLMESKPELTLRQLRKAKLDKLNRKWWKII